MKLSHELQVLQSEVKRANQRLRELEKQGLSGFSKAHSDAVGVAAMEKLTGNTPIYGTTKSGQVKFRTDIATLAKDQGAIEQLKAHVKAFLSSKESSTAFTRRKVEGLKTMQRNFANKFGAQYEGEGGLKAMQRIKEDETLFNDLSSRLDSSSAEKIINDIDNGILDRDLVSEYLNSLEADRGITPHELYTYATGNHDFINEGWEN